MRKPMVLVGFNEKCKEIIDHVQELDDENVKLESVCEIRQIQINVLKATIEKLTKENDKLKADNASLRGSCKAIGKKNTAQRNEINHLIRKVNKFKSDLAVAYVEIAEDDHCIDFWQKKCQTLMDENKALDKRLRHLLESDAIRLYDEVNHKTGEYRRDIKELDRALCTSTSKKGHKWI